ncbi:sensor histidine kinase [Clostridium transplantifaecale]|uniref:sensor histidine kinase n=1 Tax=Clostridium transplantifaecale TaxID=2479838 RepID=UPI000F639C9E|nr:HAMP domain-containing sensor histidine kinase [Clostridium transplantifaecale]
MLKKLSLRMRLTLLSAMVMAGVAVILTSMFLFGADRIFVQDLPNQITYEPKNVMISTEISNKSGAEDMQSVIFTVKKAGTRFNMWGLVGLFLMLVFGTGATWIMAGRVLKPLGDLSSTIEEISGNDLSRRVDMEIQDRQDEIGRLALSFNHMMDKVSASFERQKRFSASAAHELKTPLATILVNLEVMELDSQTPPARMEKVLSVVKTNTERMIRLTDDLFRLTSDKDSEMGEEVILEEAVAIAMDELSPLLKEKHLMVTVQGLEGIKMTGNRVMIYRAMSNLIENAAKYNCDGGRIGITAEAAEHNIKIKMKDTGIGIPPEDLPHIFEPFYRVDRSRSRAVGGAGLGLPLVRDIVEKHGGKIEIKSAPGEGTEITVEFPV